MDGLTYVSTVPKIWLGENDECKWPKDKGREKQAIIREQLPESDWYTLKKVKVLGEYCTYKEALYYEKKKENGYSSSSSDVEKGKGKRKKKLNQKYVDRDNYSVTPPPQLTCESENESNECVSSDEANETIVPMVVNSKYIEHEVPVTGTVRTSESSITPSSLIEQAEVIFEDNYQQANDDKIVSMLVNIQATLEILKAKIFMIEEKLGAVAVIEEINNDILPKLPVNSIEEIQDLERNSGVPECKKALFQYLKCTGGISERNCIFRNLEKVFTNFVAQFCSWTGQKQNFRLSGLKIMEIVKSAVRVSYPGMTDENYEKAVMQWFQHGKTRYLRQGLLREEN